MGESGLSNGDHVPSYSPDSLGFRYSNGYAGTLVAHDKWLFVNLPTPFTSTVTRSGDKFQKCIVKVEMDRVRNPAT